MDITQKHYSRSNPKQNKDSDKLQEMAEKANEWTQREGEERSRLVQGCAQHDRDVVLLTANKKLDVANTKQRATEEAIKKRKRKQIGDFTRASRT